MQGAVPAAKPRRSRGFAARRPQEAIVYAENEAAGKPLTKKLNQLTTAL